MYPILSVLLIIIGSIVSAFARKMARNQVIVICIRLAGFIAVISGLIFLYLLLTGKLVLPLV